MSVMNMPHVDICWKCRERLPDDFQLNSAEMLKWRPPIAGDIAICGACGAFHVFNSLLHKVKPPHDVLQRIMRTPELVDLQERLVKRK